MSGHSHWSTIKHKKGIADAKRGKAFSKMAALITLAAKSGGDPNENPKLKAVLEQAKAINLPKANIERAIKKGTGEIAGEELHEVLFEGYGPDNIAVLVEGITDNTNRTLSDVKQGFAKNNGKLAAEGSVRYLFDQKGIVNLKNTGDKQALELAVIDSGAEDMEWDNDILQAYTNVNDLEQVKEKLKQQGVSIESSTLGWVAKSEIESSSKEKAIKLFEALDDIDDIQEIYSNLKL